MMVNSQLVNLIVNKDFCPKRAQVVISSIRLQRELIKEYKELEEHADRDEDDENPQPTFDIPKDPEEDGETVEEQIDSG